MKVIFRDESPVCFGQGDDAGTLVWCRSNETQKDDEDENEHISTITDDMGLMSGKGPGKMAASNSTGNAQVDSDILDSFLNPSIQRRFGDAELILQDDDASFHREKRVQTFLQE